MNQWSQEEMAEKLAMSANGYAKIERGQTKLTFDKLNQIAQIFKIDVVELITKEKPLFLLVGDNSHNYGSNYYGNNEALIAENEKLKLTISHNNEIIQRQENEICKPPPPFALCYINFCTRCVLKVATAFALYIG